MQTGLTSNPDNRRKIRLAVFLISVVTTSAAVSFAAFIDNAYLLAIALIPCVIALSVSIIPVPVSSRNILICGVSSGLISLIVIIFSLATHLNELKPYLGFPEN
ncbi:MAG: hypothetical protein ACXVPN_13625 [Bacteroidia bacterium]